MFRQRDRNQLGRVEAGLAELLGEIRRLNRDHSAYPMGDSNPEGIVQPALEPPALASSQLQKHSFIHILHVNDDTPGLENIRTGLYEIFQIDDKFVTLSPLSSYGILLIERQQLDNDILWEPAAHPPNSELHFKLKPTLSCQSIMDIQDLINRGILEFYIPTTLAETIILEGWKVRTPTGAALSPQISNAEELPGVKLFSLPSGG